MKIDYFFFRLYSIDDKGEKDFLGSAFPINADGGLLTCWHVVNLAPGYKLGVHDNVTGELHEINDVRRSSRDIDLAYLPNALPNTPRPFLPLLTPPLVVQGASAFSYGFFVLGGVKSEIEPLNIEA